MEICNDHRGSQLEHTTLEDSDRAILKYSLPLSEIVVDFFGELKSATSGYATFDYEAADYQASDLVKLNMLLNGDSIDALASGLFLLPTSAMGCADKVSPSTQ